MCWVLLYLNNVNSNAQIQTMRTFHREVVLLNVLGCQLTYYGQAETNAEAWFSIALSPQKPEGSLGQTAQDGHFNSLTAPEL